MCVCVCVYIVSTYVQMVKLTQHQIRKQNNWKIGWMKMNQVKNVGNITDYMCLLFGNSNPAILQLTTCLCGQKFKFPIVFPASEVEQFFCKYKLK